MEILISALQLVLGAFLGVIGTISAQKYLKRDEQKLKDNERIRVAAENYIHSFSELIGALETHDDIISISYEDKARKATAQHRAAVNMLKPFLSKKDQEYIEMDWQMYADLFTSSMTRLSSPDRHEILDHLQRLIGYAELVQKNH